jgi:hypothetical protein
MCGPRPGGSGSVQHLALTGARESQSAGHMLVAMVDPDATHSEAPEPGPQGRCVCGEKVTIADALEVTLPNGRAGWQGYCPECGAPLFAIRRRSTAS